MAYGKRRVGRRTTRKTYRRKRSFAGKRGIARANRAIRMVKALSRRVAGEVCKFESTPAMYSNATVSLDNPPVLGTFGRVTVNKPLESIQSGVPWIMPLNWLYSAPLVNETDKIVPAGTAQNMTFDISSFTVDGESFNEYTDPVSIKNPIWYNTMETGEQDNPNAVEFADSAKGTEYQYRMKYMYLNGLFNASTSTEENTDGAMRIVLVKDKQPTGGSATWFDSNLTETSRGVFNSQRIDAQLNPTTVGRFKICYDKTLRFTRINGYKPFKYFKKIASIIRNNKDLVDNVVPEADWNSDDNRIQSVESSPPVQKNAYYLMIFSDGLNFNYTDESTTAPGTFHLFNRIAYYNN